MNSLKALLLAASSNVLIFSGVQFINAGLWTQNVVFAFVYSNTNFTLRTIMVTGTVSLYANFAFAKMYRLVTPSTAGAYIVATAVLVAFTFAVTLQGKHLSSVLLLSLAAAIATCAFVTYLINS